MHGVGDEHSEGNQIVDKEYAKNKQRVYKEYAESIQEAYKQSELTKRRINMKQTQNKSAHFGFEMCALMLFLSRCLCCFLSSTS